VNSAWPKAMPSTRSRCSARTARINSLAYFQENFEVEQVEGSAPDRIVLEANVEERPTGELQFSAGFSQIESFILPGIDPAAQLPRARADGRPEPELLALSRARAISFTEPYLFDRNISAGVDIYRQDYNNGFFNRQSATYEQSTTGIAFRAGVPLTEYLSLIGRYTLNIEDVTIDENQFFADFDGDGVRQCEPLLAGRYLCDAIGNRVNSILGLSLVHDTLNNRRRPTSGSVLSASVDFAGLGGSTRYLRARLNGSKFFDLGSNFIFSLRAEGGAISGIGDEVRLTDRFQLGEPDIRGFDIRGIGPRVVRRFYSADEDGNPVLSDLDDDRNQSDALGGRFYYFGRAELEIPLGSGAREMGLRPSLFADIGSVWGVRRPQLINSPLPDGLFVPQRNGEGQALFNQINDAAPNDAGVCTGTIVQVTNPVNPNPGCLASAANNPIGLQLPPFVEEYYGNTPKPRLTVGVGVNWNSPFGPFRIDLAYDVLSQPGDETKTLSFNVGTSF
jgi:outer membrane protein insertion porin family